MLFIIYIPTTLVCVLFILPFLLSCSFLGAFHTCSFEDWAYLQLTIQATTTLG